MEERAENEYLKKKLANLERQKRSAEGSDSQSLLYLEEIKNLNQFLKEKGQVIENLLAKIS